MFIEVGVLVPEDRIKDFHAAVGAFAGGSQMPAPKAGSSGSSWMETSVQVSEDRVAAFYAGLAVWVAQATATEAPPVEMEPDAFKAAFRRSPRIERCILKLFGDNGGRTIAWTELTAKFGIPGDPDPATALPVLAATCAKDGLTMPVHVKGTGDTAVLTMPVDLVKTVMFLDA